MNNNLLRRLFGLFIHFIPLLFVLILTAVCVQSMWSSATEFQKSRVHFLTSELVSNDTFTNLAPDSTIVQSVQVPAGTFDTFGIRLTNNEQSLRCALGLIIQEGEDMVATAQKSCSEIHGNDFLLFSFDKLSLDEPTELTFTITISGEDSGKLTLFRNTTGAGGLLINSQAQDGSIVFLIGLKEQFLIAYNSLVIVLFLIFALLIAGFFIWNKLHKKKYLLATFCLLSVGLVYVFTVPPFHYFDEYDHFLRAIELSYLDFSSGKYGSFQINPEYNSVANRTIWLNDSISGGYFSEIAEVLPVRAESARGLNVTSSAASAIPISHIAPAVLIGASRSLGVPVIIQLYVVRLVTLLMFLFIILFSIHLSPKHYLLYTSLALLPTIISQAGALSLDSLITGGSIVILSVFLTKKRCNKFELLSLLLVGVLLSILKISYLPLGALLVYGAFRTRLNIGKSLLTAGVFSLMMVGVFVGWNKYLATTSKPDPRLQETNPGAQLQNVVSDPFKYLGIISFSFIAQSSDIFVGSSQRIYTNYSLEDTKTTSIAFLLAIVTFSIFTTQIRHQISTDRKILIVLSIFATILGIQLAMYIYTIAVGATAFSVQPRYYSFLWPMMVLLGVAFLKQTTPSCNPNLIRALHITIYLISLSTAVLTFFAFVLFM